MDDLLNTPFDPIRVLLLGADSQLGGNLAESLGLRVDLVAIVSDSELVVPGCRTKHGPIRSVEWLEDLVTRHQPRWVIHCGPGSRSSWQKPVALPEPEQEAGFCRRLWEATHRVGARLTVFSSDAVFTGPRLFHEEDSATALQSQSPLARVALATEEALASTDALVVRTHAFGISQPGVETGICERVFRAIVEQTPHGLDRERFATPILATDLAEPLYRAYQSDLSGLLHLAGAERTNQAQFARAVARAFDLSGPPVGDTTCMTPPRSVEPAEETSLVCVEARRLLDWSMPLLREGLDRLAAKVRRQSVPSLSLLSGHESTEPAVAAPKGVPVREAA